ncbi:outer membrane protein assembly factor BamB family protein [Streptomyces sp. NPDC002851]
MPQPPQPPPPPGGPPQGGFGPPPPPPPSAPYGAYQQQPYGAPTMPPGGPSGGGGGRKQNTQMVIIIAAVVAVVLLVGGGVWYLNSTADGGRKDESKGSSGAPKRPSGGATEKPPSDPKGKLLFRLPKPDLGKVEQIDTRGSWLTDTVYAKSGHSEVGGYDPDSGKELWKLPLDGAACAASREVSEDGYAVVITEPQKRKKSGDVFGCSEVVVFDVNSGTKLWQRSAKVGSDKLPFKEATIAKGTVAVGGTYGGAAFDLKSGKERWQPKATDTCMDDGYAGGERLIAVRRCGEYSEPRLEVQLLDPVSGKPKWSHKVSRGIQHVSVVSTEPLVYAVSATNEVAGPTDYFVLDEKTGAMQTKIAVDPERYQSTCNSTEVFLCRHVAVTDTRLFLATKDHQNDTGNGSTNELVAFDLASGKSVAGKVDAGAGRFYPLRADGDNVIAFRAGASDHVMSIDGATRKRTVLLKLPDGVAGLGPDTSELLYGNGRLFFATPILGSGFGDEEEFLAQGYGAR